MAHELDTLANGESTMAYVGENGTPWHGLGQPIKKGASPKQIAKAAHLDWPVLMSHVKYDRVKTEGGLELETDVSHQVMYRGDTGSVLDITGKGYVPHQNIEVLEFFREYVDAGEMYIDTAGAIQGGKYIWVLAKMDEAFELPGNDQVGGYVLLMNPHIYGKGMIGKFTAVRVVCKNTIMMALGDGGQSIKVWHTHEFNKERRDQAKRNLGIARERMDAFKADAKTLAGLTLDEPEAIRVLTAVFGGDKDAALEDQNRTVKRLHELYAGAGIGAALPSSQGTGWGLLNAVTQYYDHEYGRTVDARLTMSWLGQGERNKREVMSELLQVARAGA